MHNVPQPVLFRAMRNTSQYGTVARGVLDAIRRRLPAGWRALEIGADRAPVLRLQGPDHSTADLPILARKSLAPRDVLTLLANTSGPVLVVSDYLGARSRTLLAEGGASYADATGNLRIVVSRPAIFLEGLGADRDPERSPRPLQSLKGAAASRVVRALLELDLPLGVRALAEGASTPLATVSRVVTFLETEALLARDAQRRVVAVDWPALVARWSEDYTLTQSNKLVSFLEPRGLAALWPKLARLPRYAVTGSAAGPGIAPTRLAMVYVDDPIEAARQLDLVPADVGANVWLLCPYDDVVFTRTRPHPTLMDSATVPLRTVAIAQAIVDLWSSPGRGPQEGDELLLQLTGSRRAR